MRHYCQLVELCLGNQHAVEGVPMVARQAPSDERMRDRDGQGLEAMPDELRLEVVGTVQLPLRALNTHFPGTRRADKHPRRPVHDGRAGRGTQGRIVRQPPEQGMRIEQEP